MENTSKKRKYRIKWKLVIPVVVCFILVVYLVISLIFGIASKISGGDKGSSRKDVQIYTIGDLDSKQTMEVINAEDRSNPVEIQDYNFYGESLNLYYQSYSLSLSKGDTLDGETVEFKDLLDETNIIDFTVTSKIDGGIDLAQLKDGFYSVYIVNGETTERLYYTSTIISNNVFYAVCNDGTHKKIELIADKTLFDDQNATAEEVESVLDQNYLYVKVTTVTDEENTTYDIAISTSPALVVDGVSLTGVEENGIVEAQEMYDIALEIKSQLEADGYKVLLLKDTYDQDISYYGKDGELYNAYKAKVKYMIHLDMDEYGNTGIFYSNYSGGELANSIFQSMLNGTEIFSSNDCLACDYADSEDESSNISYDGSYEIREAGGLVLAAGTYSESSQTNASFAANNKYGIDTVMIVTTDPESESSVATWKANKEKAVSAIVEGIENYLK